MYMYIKGGEQALGIRSQGSGSRTWEPGLGERI